MANAANAYIIQAARLLIGPVSGGENFYQKINCKSLEITPAQQTLTSLLSTDRDDYGQPLATYATDSTPPKIVLKFDMAPPEVFAMAFGAVVKEVNDAIGSVIDYAFAFKKDMWHAFKHAHIEFGTFELKDDTKTYENAVDFILDAKTGTVLPVSDDILASTSLKASYTYAGIKGYKLVFAGSGLSRVRIKFSGINTADDMPVTGEIWEATFTPGDAINVHSKEPISPTLTGTLIKPEGKDSVFEMLYYQA